MSDPGHMLLLVEDDAEKGVLGAMLHARSAVTQCVNLLTANDFYDDFHRVVYATIRALFDAGDGVDAQTVVGAMRSRGQLDDGAFNAVRVISLQEHAPAAVLAPDYAAIVKDRSTRRQLQKELDRCSARIRCEPDMSQLLTAVETGVFGVRSSNGKGDGGATSVELIDEFAAWYGTENDDLTKFPFPLPKLNREYAGFGPGELVLIAGYSGDGKSVLGLQMLEASCERGHNVGYFTLEMPKQQVMRRLLAMGGVPLRAIRNKTMTGTQEIRLCQRANDLKALRFTVHGRVVTVGDIRAEQLRDKYDVIVVDHLHRMSYRDRGELENMVKALKNLALDLNCAVILLAQLSRREGFPEPTTNQLRDTDVLTQEADCVLFVWRRRGSDGERLDDGRVAVRKMRDGQADTIVEVEFDPGAMRFVEKGAVGGGVR